MQKYPKIDTLFKRKEGEKGKPLGVIPEYRVTDFDNVKNIIITEEVDGSSSQLELSHHKLVGVIIDIYSRNNLLGFCKLCSGKGILKPYKNNIITQESKCSDCRGKGIIDVMYIKETIEIEVNLKKLKKWYFNNFCLDKEGKERESSAIVRIFGEVAGNKINTGGMYSKARFFRVFDVMIGEHFISFNKIREICNKVDLKTVPVLYEGEIKNCLDYDYLKNELTKNNYSAITNGIRLGNKTLIKEGGTGGYLEGYIITSEKLLLNEYGQRIKCKIKRRDFLK